MLPAARLFYVGFPLVGHELGLHTNLLEVLLHDLRHALGVRHVGARYRHVPQLRLEVRNPSILEHLLCLVGVVGVGLDALVEVRHKGRHVVGGDLPLAPERALDDLLYVDGVVEGLAHLGIVEGLLLVVHRQVANGVRWPEVHRIPGWKGGCFPTNRRWPPRVSGSFSPTRRTCTVRSRQAPARSRRRSSLWPQEKLSRRATW